MAKEPDETRWVGIRPTDPSENIPVTESTPLTDILVAPSAGNPEFLTLTKKRAPAVSDLGAISGNIDLWGVANGVNCTVKHSMTVAVVPAGQIYIMTQLSAVNFTSMCDIILSSKTRGAGKPVKAYYSVPADTIVAWDGLIFHDEDDSGLIEFCLGGGADNVKLWSQGYFINLYT